MATGSSRSTLITSTGSPLLSASIIGDGSGARVARFQRALMCGRCCHDTTDILAIVSYLDSLVEQQIAAAMARGEFDDLPGRGRPIADLDTQRQPGWFAEQLVRRERSRVRHDETMA